MNEDNASDFNELSRLISSAKGMVQRIKTLRMESTEQNNFEHAFNKRRVLTIQVGC